MGYNSKDECIYEFHRDVPKTKEKKKRKSNHSHEYFRYGHRNKEQNEVIRRLLKKHIKYLYVIRYYNTYGKYFKHGKWKDELNNDQKELLQKALMQKQKNGEN